MKDGVRALVTIAVLFVLLAATSMPAFAAITLQGSVPVGKTGQVVIVANKQLKSTGLLRVKLSAPAPRPGGYSLSFCVGPASNSCGAPGSFVVTVPAGEERIVLLDAGGFIDNVLTVGQGTTTPVPFAVEVE